LLKTPLFVECEYCDAEGGFFSHDCEGPLVFRTVNHLKASTLGSKELTRIVSRFGDPFRFCESADPH